MNEYFTNEAINNIFLCIRQASTTKSFTLDEFLIEFSSLFFVDNTKKNYNKNQREN